MTNYDGLFGKACLICGTEMDPIYDSLIVTGLPNPKAMYHRKCYEEKEGD
jgi:hypothetical protein